MLKIVLLSVFLSVGLAADINDFYGTFTSVVAFKQSPTPICAKYSFAEDPSKVQCTCSDGTKPPLVQIKIVERLESPQTETPTGYITGPILVVDDVENVAQLLNVTCDCAGQAFDYRSVVKIVNENYVLAYVGNGPRAAVANQDFLLARNLPTAALLAGVTSTIPEAKGRIQTVLCTSETYETLRPKN